MLSKSDMTCIFVVWFALQAGKLECGEDTLSRGFMLNINNTLYRTQHQFVNSSNLSDEHLHLNALLDSKPSVLECYCKTVGTRWFKD